MLGYKLQNGNIGLGALMGLAGLEGVDAYLVARRLQALLDGHLVEWAHVGVRHDDGAAPPAVARTYGPACSSKNVPTCTW